MILTHCRLCSSTPPLQFLRLSPIHSTRQLCFYTSGICNWSARMPKYYKVYDALFVTVDDGAVIIRDARCSLEDQAKLMKFGIERAQEPLRGRRLEICQGGGGAKGAAGRDGSLNHHDLMLPSPILLIDPLFQFLTRDHERHARSVRPRDTLLISS